MKKLLLIVFSSFLIVSCSKSGNDNPQTTTNTTTVKLTQNGQQTTYTGSTTTPSSNGAALSVEIGAISAMYKLVGTFSGQNILFLDFKAASPLAAKTYTLDNTSDCLAVVSGTTYSKSGTNTSGSITIASISNNIASGSFTAQFQSGSSSYTITGEFTNVVVSN